MNRSRFFTPVTNRYLHENILGIGLSVFNIYIKIAALIEYPCIQYFVLGLPAVALTFLKQVSVRESGLGVFIQVLEILMGGRRIEVVV